MKPIDKNQKNRSPVEISKYVEAYTAESTSLSGPLQEILDQFGLFRLRNCKEDPKKIVAAFAFFCLIDDLDVFDRKALVRKRNNIIQAMKDFGLNENDLAALSIFKERIQGLMEEQPLTN